MSASKEVIGCPWHGWEFEIRTGRSYFNPHRVPRPFLRRGSGQRAGTCRRGSIGADFSGAARGRLHRCLRLSKRSGPGRCPPGRIRDAGARFSSRRGPGESGPGRPGPQPAAAPGVGRAGPAGRLRSGGIPGTVSLTGYVLEDLAYGVGMRLDDPRLAVLVEESKSISIIVGFVEHTPDHQYRIASAYLEDGEIRHRAPQGLSGHLRIVR